MNSLYQYQGRRVLVTGHTGFKGTWLSLWLEHLGAKVFGYSNDVEYGSLYEHIKGSVVEALSNPSEPSVPGRCLVSPIEDEAFVANAVDECEPDLIVHLAAQALVGEGYEDPLGTFRTNVLGTAHVLEAAKRFRVPILCITSDKVYEPRLTGLAISTTATAEAFSETDRLGGWCPYSASKAAAEMVAASYRRLGTVVATARAGNVVGGGDYGKDRLLPDALRAAQRARPVVLRNPSATRPYQHVLDCLYGYLMLGARLMDPKERTVGRTEWGGAWNFGPVGSLTSRRAVEAFYKGMGVPVEIETGTGSYPEARTLCLDSSKAKEHLGWHPLYGCEEAIEAAARWYRDVHSLRQDARERTMNEIVAYGMARSLEGTT